jgi:ATP-dependent DNA helicase RecG
MKLIEDNPYVTRKDIAEKLGITIDGARYHLKKMTSSGVVRFVGKGKNGYWELCQNKVNILM